MKNSIIDVQKAKERLEFAFQSHFGNSSNCVFEIGINPETGKYVVLAFVKNERHQKAIPPEALGYSVITTIGNPPTVKG